MSRRKSRKAIVQILFRDEFHSNFFKNKKIESSFFFKNLNKKDQEFVLKTVKSIQDNKKNIDETIEKHSKNWDKKRIPLVDLNIMRLAIFEILFCNDIPDKSSINEALELAKHFGEKKSVSFINGILDQVLKNKK